MQNSNQNVEVLQNTTQPVNTVNNTVTPSNQIPNQAVTQVQQPVNPVQTQSVTQPQQVATPAQNTTTPQGEKIEYDKKGRAKRPVISYRYVIINGVGKKENGTFDAESADDVRNFLLSLNYQVLEVKERSKLDIDIAGGKFKASDLSFSLTQLSTYLKAGIPLADSVRILAKQSKKPSVKKSFFELVY